MHLTIRLFIYCSRSSFLLIREKEIRSTRVEITSPKTLKKTDISQYLRLPIWKILQFLTVNGIKGYYRLNFCLITFTISQLVHEIYYTEVRAKKQNGGEIVALNKTEIDRALLISLLCTPLRARTLSIHAP